MKKEIKERKKMLLADHKKGALNGKVYKEEL